MYRFAWFPMVVGCAVLAAPAPARANGRFPATTGVRSHPTDADTRLIATTFGLLITRDGGLTHHWVCEAAIGYGGTFDPDYAVAADGAIYATTFDGLRVTRDGGCTWQLTGAPLDGLFAEAVQIAGDGAVWTVATKADVNGAFVSADGGLSFVKTPLERVGAYWHGLAVAPANPQRVFVSGYMLPGSSPDAGLGVLPALLYRSDDGGASWQELPVDDFQFADEPLLFVEAVSAADGDVVYARVRRANPPNGDALYRSIDGGQSWVKVLDTLDAITAFSARADGQTLVVGTKFNGVRVSTDRGDSWAMPAAQPQMGCVEERFDGQLLACGANWEPDHMALGRSADADSWQTVLAFADITGPLACDPGTIQLEECALMQWPSLAEQLGIGGGGDAGPGSDGGAGAIDAASPAADAGTGGGGGGCGCSMAALIVPFVARGRRRRLTARP